MYRYAFGDFLSIASYTSVSTFHYHHHFTLGITAIIIGFVRIIGIVDIERDGVDRSKS
jgi:hypothetical protein